MENEVVNVITAEIAKLELGPGDVLLVVLKGNSIAYERAKEFHEHIGRVLGHPRFILVDANMVEFKVGKAPADHVQD